MKFDLLLGSVYAALLQFGGITNGGPEVEKLVFVPFGLLILSMMLFLRVYTKLGSHTIAAHSDNLYSTLRDGHDKKEHIKIMSIVHFEWSDDNISHHHSSNRYLKYGIYLLFSSLGAFSYAVVLI